MPDGWVYARGSASPGSSMGFKVYVVLTTSNEKGSNTVTITNA